MNKRQILGVICGLSLFGSSVQAAPPTDINDAIDKIQGDSVLLSRWLSNEFARAIPFNSTSGNVVPSQFKLFGIGVGVSAVVSGTKMDVDALHALGTDVIDTAQIDTFSRLPIPMILGHAKLGLPFGLDAGVRVGGIPSTDSDEGDTHVEVSNTVVGLDVRKKLIEEGAVKPFGLTVGLNYTRARGHISATTPYRPTGSSDVTFSADSVGTARSDWDTQSLGVQAILNKKILILNPYIGASVNKNFGDVDTTITNTGTVTYTPTPATLPFATAGSASEKADNVDVRGLLGVELGFLPFTKLTIQGELANQNKLAGSIGLRVQFR
ncbi:MAG: hypothetical protein A2992_06660 [Elusimicrobia bacterium RIFCSPLOWO2_01_FULL_59_12]|nr:MAG: hypothetical protein A2992_06660 [Elusimicrobia bacterium RIFCSPLOWO2_01_FULL_59_12]